MCDRQNEIEGHWSLKENFDVYCSIHFKHYRCSEPWNSCECNDEL